MSVLVFTIICALSNHHIRGLTENNKWIAFLTGKYLWGLYVGFAYYGINYADDNADPISSLIIGVGLSIWSIHNMGLLVMDGNLKELNRFTNHWIGYITNRLVDPSKIRTPGEAKEYALHWTFIRHTLLLMPLFVGLAVYRRAPELTLLPFALSVAITLTYALWGLWQDERRVAGAEYTTGGLLGVTLGVAVGA